MSPDRQPESFLSRFFVRLSRRPKSINDLAEALGVKIEVENDHYIKVIADDELKPRDSSVGRARYFATDGRMGFEFFSGLPSVLLEAPFRVLQEHFISFQHRATPFRADLSLTVHYSPKHKQIEYTVAPIGHSWAKPWSFTEVLSVFDPENIWQLNARKVLEIGELRISQTVADHMLPVRECIALMVKPLLRELEAAEMRLATQADRNTLVTLFQFPSDISTACGQYLLYFAQFLQDLGIEAETEVQHRASDILFSVTPNAGPEALGRIREALDVYLHIPGAPNFDVAASNAPSVAVQQLQANVFHLRGQLAIAGALLDTRQAQIEALELSNFQLRQMTSSESGSVLLLKGATTRDEAEPLINGLVDVLPIEGKGLRINLPELLRRLKRK